MKITTKENQIHEDVEADRVDSFEENSLAIEAELNEFHGVIIDLGVDISDDLDIIVDSLRFLECLDHHGPESPLLEFVDTDGSLRSLGGGKYPKEDSLYPTEALMERTEIGMEGLFSNISEKMGNIADRIGTMGAKWKDLWSKNKDRLRTEIARLQSLRNPKGLNDKIRVPAHWAKADFAKTDKKLNTLIDGLDGLIDIVIRIDPDKGITKKQYETFAESNKKFKSNWSDWDRRGSDWTQTTIRELGFKDVSSIVKSLENQVEAMIMADDMSNRIKNMERTYRKFSKNAEKMAKQAQKHGTISVEDAEGVKRAASAVWFTLSQIWAIARISSQHATTLYRVARGIKEGKPSKEDIETQSLLIGPENDEVDTEGWDEVIKNAIPAIISIAGALWMAALIANPATAIAGGIVSSSVLAAFVLGGINYTLNTIIETIDILSEELEKRKRRNADNEPSGLDAHGSFPTQSSFVKWHDICQNALTKVSKDVEKDYQGAKVSDYERIMKSLGYSFENNDFTGEYSITHHDSTLEDLGWDLKTIMSLAERVVHDRTVVGDIRKKLDNVVVQSKERLDELKKQFNEETSKEDQPSEQEIKEAKERLEQIKEDGKIIRNATKKICQEHRRMTNTLVRIVKATT